MKNRTKQIALLTLCFPFRKRICKSGAGQEETKGECDTPGFPLTIVAEVVREHGRHLKLRMERNHARINQTPMDMLLSWRGNCDIQVLVYESHPDRPDIKEISRVTDYVVAYQCKGNTTYQEEKETTKNIIMAAEEGIGGLYDLKRVCKQVMNKATTRRLISKQEASVLLAELPLTLCSEFTETVSISNSKRLSIDGANDNSKFITKYAKRAERHHHLSLHQYFFVYREELCRKPPAIPHYVGVAGYPCFPVSEGYARHVLICFKPWLEYPNQKSWKDDFNLFINSKFCPLSARLVYDRVLQRHFNGTKFVDPTAKEIDHSRNPISREDEIALMLAGMGAEEMKDFKFGDFDSIDKGLTHTWDNPPKVCSFFQHS